MANGISTKIATGQVTVAATATLIAAGRPGRITITIENHATTAVYIGDSTVTTSTGTLIPASVGANYSLSTEAPIYGIVASGTEVVSYVETY